MSEKKIMDLDEIEATLSKIGREGDGAQQIRALQMLRGAKDDGTATLIPPMSDAEIIDRLARLIKAAGTTASQLAYRKAFPASKLMISKARPKLTEDDIVPIDRATLPRTLRDLYREFPEIKRGGIPKGFPLKHGKAVQAEWVKNEALKMRMDKERAKLDLINLNNAPANAGE